MFELKKKASVPEVSVRAHGTMRVQLCCIDWQSRVGERSDEFRCTEFSAEALEQILVYAIREFSSFFSVCEAYEYFRESPDFKLQVLFILIEPVCGGQDFNFLGRTSIFVVTSQFDKKSLILVVLGNFCLLFRIMCAKYRVSAISCS